MGFWSLQKCNKFPLSENHDRFRWPIYNEENQIGSTRNLNGGLPNGLDFDIDFYKQLPGKGLFLDPKDYQIINSKNLIPKDDLNLQQQKFSKTSTDGFFNNQNTLNKNNENEKESFKKAPGRYGGR